MSTSTEDQHGAAQLWATCLQDLHSLQDGLRADTRAAAGAGLAKVFSTLQTLSAATSVSWRDLILHYKVC